jgi:hypothetical protein
MTTDVVPVGLTQRRFDLVSDIRLDCGTQQLKYEFWSGSGRPKSKRRCGSDVEQDDERAQAWFNETDFHARTEEEARIIHLPIYKGLGGRGAQGNTGGPITVGDADDQPIRLFSSLPH